MAVRELLRRQGGEALTVFMALVALVIAGPVLVRAGSVGWRNGVLFAAASFLNGFLPGNVDVPVVLLAGVIVAWLSLFVLDGTKRIQTLAMVPAAVIVAVTLGDLDHVIDAINRAPLPFILSFTITVIGTLVISSRFRAGPPLRQHGITGVRLLQFPEAAHGLFLSLAVVITIVAGQYPFIPRSSDNPSVPVVFAAAAIAIIALGTFVQYRARRDVITLAPDGKDGTTADAYTLTGLYDIAKAGFYGTPLDRSSEKALERAIANPRGAIEAGFTGPIRFAYLSKRLRRLIVEINTSDYRFSSVTKADLGQLSGSGVVSKLKYQASRIAATLVPQKLSGGSLIGDEVAESVILADQILIVIPYPEGSTPESVKRAFELLVEIERQTPAGAKLVITHADRADIETDEFSGGSHRRKVLNKLDSQLATDERHEGSVIETVRNDLQYFDSVHLLKWDLPHGQNRDGFERLLTEISG